MRSCFRALLFLPVVLSAILPPLHAQETATEKRITDSSDKPVSELHSERWSSIDLATSGLRLDLTGAVLLSKVEMPGCTRELLRMQWRTNDPIDLYVIRPVSAKPLPVVLLIYNYTYDTDVFRADRWCERAKENGFAIAGLPSALSPSRLHAPRPMKQWFVSQLQEALATSTHDVQMALNSLSTRGDLDMNRVGVFGQGSGGAVAILAAAADPRIRALDVMDPWGDWPVWLRESAQIPADERAAYLQPGFLDAVSTLDPITFLPRLAGRALRIQQRMDDPATPVEVQARLAAAAPDAGQGQKTRELQRFATLAAEAQGLGDNGILGWFHDQFNSGDSRVLLR